MSSNSTGSGARVDGLGSGRLTWIRSPVLRRYPGLVGESLTLAQQALLLRYPTVAESPIAPATLLQVRRPEDEGHNLWVTMNRVQESLVRGGLADDRRDRRGQLRSVRPLRGIDSKVSLNRGLWELAERLAEGRPLATAESVTVAA